MSTPDRKARVLIVDDDPGVLRAATRVLGVHHQVRGASRPSEALDQVQEWRPDLAVCDIRMPEMDGFALMQGLRSRVPDLDFILMTGSHSEPDANLVRAIRQQAFYFIHKPFHRDVLETLVNRCLEMRWLRVSRARHARRMEDELAEARVFQQTMLADPQATIGTFRVAARWRACSELGGDFYDYMDAGDGRVAFIVADVRGHGASAALQTAMVKAAFRSTHGAVFDPSRCVRRLSASLRSFGPDRFVTVFCGVVDPAHRTLDYVGAGHPPALVRAPGLEPMALASTSPLVSSLFADESWRGERVSVPANAEILIYTDGVLDAPAGGTRFPMEALLSHARSQTRSAALLDAILADIDARAAGRPIGDDVTMLSVAWGG